MNFYTYVKTVFLLYIFISTVTILTSGFDPEKIGKWKAQMDMAYNEEMGNGADCVFIPPEE